jgi:Spy/CpxP family protein refolding chaperone
MKTREAPTRQLKNPGRRGRRRIQLKSQATISALAATLLSAVCLMMFCAHPVSAQNLRRQMRIQRKIDRKPPRPAGNQNKLAPSNGGKEESDAAEQPELDRTTTQPIAPSLEGIKQRGLGSLFSREEASLWIPGFGARATMLVIFRQLNLAPEQKIKIRGLRRQVGEQLRLSRQEMNQLEAQLDEAIYGSDPVGPESYDPARVKELTEQVLQKRAEWFRLQTEVESQFRQILTPDQFFVYRELALQMMRPAARPLVNPAARQLRQQRRLGAQPNPQNKPNSQDQPDGMEDK